MPTYVKRTGLWIALIWILSVLAACGGAPTAVPAAAPTAIPAAAPTTVPAAAPTAEPMAEAPTAVPEGGEPTTVPEGGEPTAVPAEAPTAAPAPSGDGTAIEGATGTIVADIGFRPQIHGFKFENYGEAPGVTNLTPIEMRQIFGDTVCGSMANDQCTLTPPAEAWMNEQNKSMGGGHCYGFSVLSLALFTNKMPIADLGASDAQSLQLPGNEKLQRAIAYSFVHQVFPGVREGSVAGTPNEVLDKMIELLKPGSTDIYTIGFFKAQGGGGHAVTPFAVEDRGGGKFVVWIYDNNWPGMSRQIEFDRNANSWSYDASINPGVPAERYEGNADTKSLFMFPTTPGLNQQPCLFCASATAGRAAGMGAPAALFNEVMLEGEGHLLITDEEGRKTGYVGEELVNEIPGAEVYRMMSADLWQDNEEPTYRIPVGVQFTITLDGDVLTAESEPEIWMIGPGYNLGITGIKLAPDEKDTITFSPDGMKMSYQSSTGESPDIILGIETSGADYEFLVKGLDLEPNGVVNVGIDAAKGELLINSSGNTQTGNYGLLISRIDEEGEQIFGSDQVELDPDDTAHLEYGAWKGDGTPLELGIDRGSTGTIADTIELTDVGN